MWKNFPHNICCAEKSSTQKICAEKIICDFHGVKKCCLDKCSPIETCHTVHHCNVLSQVPLVKKFCSAEVRFVNANFENRNANFANPKLMLHAMPASKSEKERRFAVNVIKKIKKGADLGDFLPCQVRLPMSTLMQPTCKT